MRETLHSSSIQDATHNVFHKVFIVTYDQEKKRDLLSLVPYFVPIWEGIMQWYGSIISKDSLAEHDNDDPFLFLLVMMKGILNK